MDLDVVLVLVLVLDLDLDLDLDFVFVFVLDLVLVSGVPVQEKPVDARLLRTGAGHSSVLAASRDRRRPRTGPRSAHPAGTA